MGTPPADSKGARRRRLYNSETLSGLGSIPQPTRRSSRRRRGRAPNSIDLGAVGKNHTHGSGRKHASSRIELGRIFLPPLGCRHTGPGIHIRASRHAIHLLRDSRIAGLFRVYEGGAIRSLDRSLRRYTAPDIWGGGPIYHLTKAAGRRAIRFASIGPMRAARLFGVGFNPLFEQLSRAGQLLGREKLAHRIALRFRLRVTQEVGQLQPFVGQHQFLGHAIAVGI